MISRSYTERISEQISGLDEPTLPEAGDVGGGGQDRVVVTAVHLTELLGNTGLHSLQYSVEQSTHGLQDRKNNRRGNKH